MNTLDVSRHLDQPEKRYVSVRLQQGRVLLDGDASEQQVLGEREDARISQDLLGLRGSPDEGFSLGSALPLSPEEQPEQTEPLVPLALLPQEIIRLGDVPTAVRPVSIRAGVHYLGGMRLVLEQPEHIALQRDFLQMGPADLPPLPEPEEEEETPRVPLHALYVLHAWEQTVSAVEDEELLEVALGQETTGRLRWMRRVEVLSQLDPRDTNPTQAWSRFIREIRGKNSLFEEQAGRLSSTGRLALRFSAEQQSEDCGACVQAPAYRFLGANHQTLKIQLRSPEEFVWALDSASTLLCVEVRGLEDPEAELLVTILSDLPDTTLWPVENQVVEILPFAAQLDGVPPVGAESPFFKKVAARTGELARVQRAYHPDSRTIVLERGEAATRMREFISSWDPRHPASCELNWRCPPDTRHFYMRLWHVAEEGGSLTLPVRGQGAGEPLPGTQVIPEFMRPGRAGDYWIFSSRPETRYPATPFALSENPRGIPPTGPVDYYSPLGLVLPVERSSEEEQEEGDEDRVGSVLDARAPVVRLSDRGCVTFSVGDGVRSQGDFLSIQAAIDALPETGGTIQLREGTHRERVVLAWRKSVTIEGCGPQVIWESPRPEEDPALQQSPLPSSPLHLLKMSHVSHIRLRGFAFHSAEDIAVLAMKGCAHIEIRDVQFVAGRRIGRDFVPGSEEMNVPLCLLEACEGVQCTSSTWETSARPAIRARISQQLVFDQLTLVGAAQSQNPPQSPLIDFENCPFVSLRNSVLSSFGQGGVRLRGQGTTDAELRDLAVIVGQHRALVGSPRVVTPARSGIEIEDVERARIVHSTVTLDESRSEYAGIVLQGKELFVEDNRVEALASCWNSPRAHFSPSECEEYRTSAWGGIHVRGGSEGVYIRNNRIFGGVGHGITLGSVAWGGVSGPVVHESVGRGQVATRRDGALAATGLLRSGVTGRLRAPFIARNEGPIRDLQIVGNRIEQMNGNGISVISVLGLPTEESLIELEGIRIESNTIVDNLQAPSDEVTVRDEILPFPASMVGTGLAVQVLPAAAIVLASVERADIRGNVILNNGRDPRLPTSGIFILVGNGLNIASNRIVGNGARAPLDSPRATPPGLLVGVRAGIAVLLAGVGDVSSVRELDGLLDTWGAEFGFDGSSLRVVGNVVQHPEGRALHAVGTGPMIVEGNSLASEGNHGADTLTDANQVGDVVYVMNLGHPSEIDLEREPSEFTEGYLYPSLTLSYLRVESKGFSPRAFFGNSGTLSFQNNQVSLDWEIRRTPKLLGASLSFFPVALISLDHAGVLDNQFSFRLRGRRIRQSPSPTRPALPNYQAPTVGQVLVIGATSNVSRNRFSEALGHTNFSLCSLSHLMTQVTFNQAAHELLVSHEPDFSSGAPLPQEEGSDSSTFPVDDNFQYALRAHNQVLFQPKKQDTLLGVPGMSLTAWRSVRRFMRLIWRQL